MMDESSRQDVTNIASTGNLNPALGGAQGLHLIRRYRHAMVGSMKTLCRVVFTAFLLLRVPAGGEDLPAGPEESVSAALDEDTVALIGGEKIPYPWFLHEFRSSFFRHAHAPDVRQAVFDGFLKRALVYEAARQAGVDQNPELVERIRERLEGTRAFMEYQLAMTERAMVSEQFLADEHLSLEDFPVTEEALLAFLKEEVAKQPGAPRIDSLDELPPGVREQWTTRLQQALQAQALDQRMEEWMETFGVTIHTDLVQRVPFPKGAMPPTQGSSGR